MLGRPHRRPQGGGAHWERSLARDFDKRDFSGVHSYRVQEQASHATLLMISIWQNRVLCIFHTHDESSLLTCVFLPTSTAILAGRTLGGGRHESSMRGLQLQIAAGVRKASQVCMDLVAFTAFQDV